MTGTTKNCKKPQYEKYEYGNKGIMVVFREDEKVLFERFRRDCVMHEINIGGDGGGGGGGGRYKHHSKKIMGKK